MPLRRVAVDVCIQSFVADVSSELLYKNEESDPVEAIFTFPMDADSAVYAFQARIQDTIIKAQIQDKKEVTSRKEGPRAGAEAGMEGWRNAACGLGWWGSAASAWPPWPGSFLGAGWAGLGWGRGF